MTEQPDPADAAPPLPALKVVEPKVDPENPWGDDKLSRREIANRLTNIIRGQEAPFVISLDGRWGTGKTFLLDRWAHDRRKQGFEAIYYNAWEDDFAEDPLLAIIAQLSEHLSESWGDRVSKLVDVAGPLLYYSASVASLAASGIPLPPIPACGDESPPLELDVYQEKRAAKDDLKESLELLASDVRDETGETLVFIIDELDRCRPTFAIELLERVKHIFDVPNIVFVFGINRSELVKSLESVYGEIDAGTYLRRFFDMEFVLPDADPTRFCWYLLERFRVPEHFQALSESGGGRQRAEEFRMAGEYLPVLLGNMGLSLRDMDYCVRFLALTLRTLEGTYPLHPALFIVLVALKVQEPTLYRGFVEGRVRGAEVINYLNGLSAAGVGGTEHQLINQRRYIEFAQAAIYAADDADTVRRQLERLRQGSDLDRPEYLSEEHARLGPEDSATLVRIGGLVGESAGDSRFLGASLGYLAEKIDLYSDFARPR